MGFSRFYQVLLVFFPSTKSKTTFTHFQAGIDEENIQTGYFILF